MTHLKFSCYRFQAALVKYGVGKADIFQTNDLSEKKDVANVTNTLYALGRAVSNIFSMEVTYLFS